MSPFRAAYVAFVAFVRRAPKVLQQVSPKGAVAWGGKGELPPHLPELLPLFPFGWGIFNSCGTLSSCVKLPTF